MRPVRRTAIHPCRRVQRRRRRAARTVASHRQPADPASRRDLVRTRRDHAAALRPERGLTTTSTTRPGCATSTSSTGPPQPPCTDRPLRPERAPRRQANRVNRPAGGTLSTTMFETTDRHPRHVPRPPPAHCIRHRRRVPAPGSHRRRRRDRPMARALHRARPRTRRRAATAARRIGCTAKRCSTVTHSLMRWMEECPPVPRPVVSSTPDGESTPTRDLPAAGLAHRLENQRLRGRPLTAATHEPPCHDAPYDPMSAPTVAGTVRRPSADLHHPRAREALSAHPPAPVDLATRGSLQQRAENTSAPATLAP